MEKTVLKVEGMSCSHCENAVKEAVGSIPGVSAVSVDLSGKTVTVEYDSGKTAIEAVKLAIDGQGFEVV